ncbi:MAG: transporter [Candidatus Margulisbacteria bacterium]|nr:transporter [Candidatus Margulisiibacteriota bacterium]
MPARDQKYQYQEQLFAQYGFTDRLEIDGQATYQQNYMIQGNSAAQTSGPGDSTLFLRYCIIEEDGRLPHLTALAQVKVPTGNYQHADPAKLGTDLMGTGSWDHGYGLIMTKKMRPFLLHLDAVYNLPLETQVDGVKILYGQYLNYDLGLEYFLPGGFNLMLEANGLAQRNRRQDGAEIPNSGLNSLTIAPGLGWSNDAVQLLLAYQRTLSGANTDALDAIAFDFVCTF